jgi:hypothetical protein
LASRLTGRRSGQIRRSEAYIHSQAQAGWTPVLTTVSKRTSVGTRQLRARCGRRCLERR